MIKDILYTQVTPRTIFCVLILENDWEIHGFSACKNVDYFNEDVGKRLAHEHALRRLSEFIDSSPEL